MQAGGKEGKWFHVMVGLQQESVISAQLFNVYYLGDEESENKGLRERNRSAVCHG